MSKRSSTIKEDIRIIAELQRLLPTSDTIENLAEQLDCNSARLNRALLANRRNPLPFGGMVSITKGSNPFYAWLPFTRIKMDDKLKNAIASSQNASLRDAQTRLATEGYEFRLRAIQEQEGSPLHTTLTTAANDFTNIANNIQVRLNAINLNALRRWFRSHGWRPHPENDNYWYKEQMVLTAVQLGKFLRRQEHR